MLKHDCAYLKNNQIQKKVVRNNEMWYSYKELPIILNVLVYVRYNNQQNVTWERQVVLKIRKRILQRMFWDKKEQL